jgi:hypothetical protein
MVQSAVDPDEHAPNLKSGWRLFLAQRRQVEIDHRGLQRTVPEILLDEAQIDSGFKQMRGVAVSERMDRNRLLELQLVV